MIHTDIIAFPVFGKAVVAGTVNPLFRVRSQHRAAFLDPAFGIQEIRALHSAEHAHAIAGSRGAGGIGEKDSAVMLYHRRSLVDPEAYPLPVIVRGGQKYLHRGQLYAGFHAGNIQIGNLSAHADFLRPDKISVPTALKNRGVQGEGAERKFIRIRALHLPPLHPGILHGILAGTFQHIGTDGPQIIPVIPGKIDIPPAEYIMNLRSPYMLAHGAALMAGPHGDLLRLSQALYGIRMTQDDPVIGGHGSSEIIAAVRRPSHKGVRPL